MKTLSRTDRRLLDEIQSRFPLCRRPYTAIGERVNLCETDVIKRLRRLRNAKFIRRIGPVYDARASGLKSTLVAASVPAARVKKAADIINACGFVTHNYLRCHYFNIWFTVSARGLRGQRAALRRLRAGISPRSWLDLPTKRVFKIGVLFNAELSDDRSHSGQVTKGLVRPREKKKVALPVKRSAIKAIPFNLDLVPKPFPRGSIGIIKSLLGSGHIRRFGAILDGGRLGYKFNALVAWKVRTSQIEAVGRRLALFPYVSHCYERKKGWRWPYNLYTVVHDRRRREGLKLIKGMAACTGIGDYVVLETVRGLKRTSLKPLDLL